MKPLKEVKIKNIFILKGYFNMNKKIIKTLNYEISTERCEYMKGATREAIAIQNFIKKLSEEKGYNCIGLIRVHNNFPGCERITISEKGNIIVSERVSEYLRKSRYGIQLLVMVNDSYGFEKELEEYLHKREVETVSQCDWVYGDKIEELAKEMVKYSNEKLFAVDCYGEDLNKLALPFVRTVESYNYNLGRKYSIFCGYDYGEEEVKEVRYY